jgi:hypothetical protein
VSDRIELGIEVDGELAEARDAHAAFIAGETLARELVPETLEDPEHTATVELDGDRVVVTLRHSGAG